MKIKFVAPIGVVAVALGMAGVTAGPASAANNIKPFGQQETLNEIGYTVKGLKPSSDPVPHNGRLYSATVTVEDLMAVRGIGEKNFSKIQGLLSVGAPAPKETSKQ